MDDCSSNGSETQCVRDGEGSSAKTFFSFCNDKESDGISGDPREEQGAIGLVCVKIQSHHRC